jgi:hypothetical protein
MLASSIGVRAKAIATAVASSRRSVSPAATASGRKGSRGPSKVKAPS